MTRSSKQEPAPLATMLRDLIASQLPRPLRPPSQELDHALQGTIALEIIACSLAPGRLPSQESGRIVRPGTMRQERTASRLGD
jgi:hypothetical protein